MRFDPILPSHAGSLPSSSFLQARLLRRCSFDVGKCRKVDSRLAAQRMFLSGVGEHFASHLVSEACWHESVIAICGDVGDLRSGNFHGNSGPSRQIFSTVSCVVGRLFCGLHFVTDLNTAFREVDWPTKVPSSSIPHPRIY